MILAGPPVEAMMYVNESSGLEPSLYGGGGSPSSRSRVLERSLVSRGSAAFVSATAAAAAELDDSLKGGAGVKAGRDSLAPLVTKGLLVSWMWVEVSAGK
jgi:hypothetical protein